MSSHPPRGTPTAASRAEGTRAALCIVAALIASVLLASCFPLLDPDEGRNAEIAREMARSGSLLVPTLEGMPYLDKPPGFFWVDALAIRLAGATRQAARSPSAAAAALTLWLVWRRARGVLPGSAALLAVGLLATAPLFAILSAYVIFDMPLTFCVAAVWTLLAEEVERGPGMLRRAAMYAAVTAGVLIKGPVMLAWAIGGSVGASLLLRRLQPMQWLRWPPGWLMVLGIAGGWFAIASARYPEYPHYAFAEETFERIASGSFRREHPPWFVPLVLVAGALPWSLATPWTSRISTAGRVGLGFVLFAIVFFTVSRSKLATYLLPCLPPLALVASESWRASWKGGAWRVTAAYATLALVCAAIGLHWIGLPGKHVVQSFLLPALPLAVAFVLLAGVSVLGVFTRRSGFTFAALLAFTPVTLAVAGSSLVRYAASESGEPLAGAIASAEPGGSLRFERCYSAGTEFALDRRSDLLSARGAETTSTYQFRYRERLLERGQWTLLSEPPVPDRASVIVRPMRNPGDVPPEGMSAFYEDRRFVAYGRVRSEPGETE